MPVLKSEELLPTRPMMLKNSYDDPVSRLAVKLTLTVLPTVAEAADTERAENVETVVALGVRTVTDPAQGQLGNLGALLPFTQE